jgi:5-methylthioadenosine/S-adenosylhomocysteine deaminase
MHKIACDTLIEAGYVLPIAPENRALRDCSVCLKGDRIADIGPSVELTERYAPREHLRFPGGILTPGLINAHGHAGMTLLRGAGEDMLLEPWLRERIWPLEHNLVDAEFVEAGVELAIAEMLGRGVTTIVDMYFYPEVTARVAIRNHVRAVLPFPIFEGKTNWARDVDECFHLGFALHDACRGNPLVEVAFGPHAPYTVSRRTLERILMYSQELGLGVHIHLHETAAEVAAVREREGRSWIELLDDIGLLNPQLQAVHMTQVTPAEIERFALTGAHVIHCPGSNLKLADGICPVNALDAAGVNVALGTDGGASNNSLDLLHDARLASLLAKIGAGRADAGKAPETLRKATLGGARALGREDDLGSIEPGKIADLVVFTPASIAAEPLYDPFAALLHNGSAWSAGAVWVGGRQIVADGQPLLIDNEAARARIHQQIRRVEALLRKG